MSCAMLVTDTKDHDLPPCCQCWVTMDMDYALQAENAAASAKFDICNIHYSYAIKLPIPSTTSGLLERTYREKPR